METDRVRDRETKKDRETDRFKVKVERHGEIETEM